jgi:glycosyltransferase involved in cell wall biosynthesis
VNSHRRLLLAAQPWDGGVAQHVVALVEALTPGRFDVDVACPRGSLTWTSLEGHPGVELHAMRPHRRPHPGDTRSWLTLQRLVGRADVIHVHSSKAGFIGRLASFLHGKSRACVFSPHGWSFWAAEGLESRFYVQLERMAARWCRTIVALSGDEREAGLAERIGRPDQYRVIPNGVRLERFALPRAPVRGRILMVGRLAPPKRPDLALHALASVRQAIPEAELHLVGDGPLRPQAEALTAELGLDGAVRFLGSREDVPELLATAECALLASDYEGCPLAVVEAMAAGVPVAATDVGGTGELVQAGRTGELGPPGDAHGLAGAVERLLTNPGRAAELGAEGRRAAAQGLSLEVMVERLVELYDDLPAATRTRE